MSVKKQLIPVFQHQPQLCSPTLPLLFFLPVLFSARFSLFDGSSGLTFTAERGWPGKVSDLPFIGSPLTCELVRGMFFKVTCCGVNHSFILKKKSSPVSHTPSCLHFLFVFLGGLSVPRCYHLQMNQQSPRRTVF